MQYGKRFIKNSGYVVVLGFELTKYRRNAINMRFNFNYLDELLVINKTLNKGIVCQLLQ